MAKSAKRSRKKDPAVDRHPPALKAYLERIGAETISFRKAMVKEYSKGKAYYIERTMIEISPDGTIKCSRKEQCPTKEEIDQIKAQFSGGDIDFPVSIIATQAGYERWLNEQSGDKERFFGLWDRHESGYKMVQERVYPPNGQKYFVPWSYWSDGEWRSMEPEGSLPFWKPKAGSRLKFMIHEGCKAAKFMNDLLADEERLAAHPWRKTIEEYEHWGMIGGALAPHRTNYDELRRERPEEVVYVCDHDYAGESALQEVSRHWGGSLKGIKFGKEFPVSWDMADPHPKKMFTQTGRYIGPQLKSLMQWATRATEIIPSEGKGRPVTVLKRSMKEEWIHAVRPEVYIHRDWPDKIWLPTEFNNNISPYSDVDDTARLLRKDGSSKTAVLKYDPGKEPGVFGENGRYINTHVGSDVEEEKGDASPFLEFMEKLVPEEGDRRELMRWCATLIARPSIKMSYGVLLISETQGVGKTTLGERILIPLMGKENISTPSEEDICNSPFNYWMAHKRLAVVNEIYAGHSTKAYNKLKSLITDKIITVNKKFQAAYEIENWMHIFACSNSMRALQLSHDDRRWFVPKITEEKQPFQFWEGLNVWLVESGGLGKIKFWAKEFLEEVEPVMHGANAPWSKTKGEIVEEGYSPGMTLVAQLFERLNEELAKPKAERWTRPAASSDFRTREIDESIFVLDIDLVELIRNNIYDGRQSDRLEKPLTVRKVAKQKGWLVSEAKATTVPSWGCAGSNARILVRDPSRLEKMPGELVKEGKKPFDVREFMLF